MGQYNDSDRKISEPFNLWNFSNEKCKLQVEEFQT